MFQHLMLLKLSVKSPQRKHLKLTAQHSEAESETFWKAEAKSNPGKYTREDLAKMEKGRAPTGPEGHPM